MAIGGGGPQPIRFERAMVFVDGTNLLCPLRDARVKLNIDLSKILQDHLSGRKLLRCYLYTTEQSLQEGKRIHREHLTDGLRVVLGEGVQIADGNIREKGVDALLVADLVYHAAVKNYDYALVVSTDTDFAHALHRVEDFGCRTAVFGFCSDVPSRLKGACDETIVLPRDYMLRNNLVSEI